MRAWANKKNGLGGRIVLAEILKIGTIIQSRVVKGPAELKFLVGNFLKEDGNERRLLSARGALVTGCR